MKLTNKIYTILTIIIVVSFQINAQLVMTVNSLADDEYSYAWDDPNTPEDESIDGICQDELGRCTIRAAIDESNNMSQPIDLTFSVNGTINLMDILYPVNGSIINGGRNVEISGVNCFELDENTQIAGMLFNNAFQPIYIYGKHNKIGSLLNGNVFTNCYIAVEIDGDSNEVISNYFGIDTAKVLKPNTVGLMIWGNNNIIGKPVATYSNTICGSSLAGISISEGGGNEIKFNFIGTTSAGDLGLGNSQGILIGGSDANIIGGHDPVDGNIISGNTVDGISISGVPPDSYSDNTLIKNNIIGLTPDKSDELPNGRGIVITNATTNAQIVDNIISGNTTDGIYIFGYDAESLTTGHIIHGNSIGTNGSQQTFGNGNDGILIAGNVGNVIIGQAVNGDYSGNSVIGNGSVGVDIVPFQGFSPQQITVRRDNLNQNLLINLFIDSTANNGIKAPFNLQYNSGLITGKHQLANAIIDIYAANAFELPASSYTRIGTTNTDPNGNFSLTTGLNIDAFTVTATDQDGNTSNFARLNIISDVEKENDNIPTEFSLHQNYPNPFNPSTTIMFSIPQEELVTLKIYNSLGEEVATLANEYKPAGNYSVSFDAGKLTSGVYLYKITAGSYSQIRKMMLVK
jgi:hypothetical protein